MIQKTWIRWLASVGIILILAGVMNSAGSVDAAGASGASKFNYISMPIDASATITPFKASGLAAHMGSGVQQVLLWDPTTQQFRTWTPAFPFDDFDLAVGGAYFVLLDASASSSLSLVGTVPDPGTVSFALQTPTGTGCRFNSISLPLDQGAVTKASELAAALGGVDQALSWDVATQQFRTWTPSFTFDDFSTAIGYPYFVCLNSSASTSWP